ncbi:phosphate transport system regulatory protein PhoU [Thiosulfatimonas sediminis]|uniref:Phosphate-specific transport system accessory protein PhoU n=1 Tax=Thiosulfatimonas sediminis TaxID=2675054 RepID=A0A6F8PTB6_9GAMM|nr:phosphate signaling complex protein PhoU [Thiosulfatimonas sediminis]BBP45349.1 phosphate transport system regulatory protein PhoU [Thiosulfatimonas sediminis]
MNRDEFNSHISEQLNRNLEALFNQVLEMGGVVEQQLQDVSQALENSDEAKAINALNLDKIINREEIEIDRLCAAVLARQQPTASDLRLIVMSIRIAVDLERMGDEAVKIAKLAITQCKLGGDCTQMPAYAYLKQLMVASSSMLKSALNAFTRLELSDILGLYKEETRMDEVLKLATAEIQAKLVEASTSEQVALYIQMLLAVRAAERITDHALNIAESVVYLVRGKDVRQMDEAALADFLHTK